MKWRIVETERGRDRSNDFYRALPRGLAPSAHRLRLQTEAAPVKDINLNGRPGCVLRRSRGRGEMIRASALFATSTADRSDDATYITRQAHIEALREGASSFF